MSDARRGSAIAGMLTGALLGVTLAMALAPTRADRRDRESGDLLARGRAVLDAAASGLEPHTSSSGV